MPLTKVLANFVGADGATVYTDDTGLVWDFEGGVEIRDNELRMPPVTGAEDAIIDVGSFDDLSKGAFTVEFFFKANRPTQSVVSARALGSNGTLFTLNITDLDVTIEDHLGATVLQLDGGQLLNATPPAHLAIVKTGVVMHLFLNGNLVAFGIASGGDQFPEFTGFGFKNGPGGNEVRIPAVRISAFPRYVGMTYTIPSDPLTV